MWHVLGYHAWAGLPPQVAAQMLLRDPDGPHLSWSMEGQCGVVPWRPPLSGEVTDLSEFLDISSAPSPPSNYTSDTWETWSFGARKSLRNRIQELKPHCGFKITATTANTSNDNVSKSGCRVLSAHHARARTQRFPGVALMQAAPRLCKVQVITAFLPARKLRLGGGDPRSRSKRCRVTFLLPLSSAVSFPLPSMKPSICSGGKSTVWLGAPDLPLTQDSAAQG